MTTFVPEWTVAIISGESDDEIDYEFTRHPSASQKDLILRYPKLGLA